MAAVGASAAGFGVLPVLAVWGAEAGLNVMTLLILRFALTAALLPLMLAGRPSHLRPPVRTLGGLSVLGLLFATQSVLYLAAVARIPPGLAVLLHYVYPVIVLLFSVASGQERLTVRLSAPMVAAMVGLALTVGTPGSTDMWGVLCALACAVVYATYVVLGTKLSSGVESGGLTMYVVSFSALVLTVLAVPTGRFDLGFEPRGWAVIAAIAVMSTAMPIALFFAGSKILGATRASVVSMAEPVVGILAAWAAFGAEMTAAQWTGGVILLAGAVLSVRAPTAPRSGSTSAAVRDGDDGRTPDGDDGAQAAEPVG